MKNIETKDLGKLQYFLGIEVAQSEKGIVLSQRKYVLDLLEETGLLGAKPADSPIEGNGKDTQTNILDHYQLIYRHKHTYLRPTAQN